MLMVYVFGVFVVVDGLENWTVLWYRSVLWFV